MQTTDNAENPLTLHYRLIIEGEHLVDPSSVQAAGGLQELLNNIPDRDLFNHDPGPNGAIVNREVIGIELHIPKKNIFQSVIDRWQDGSREPEREAFIEDEYCKFLEEMSLRGPEDFIEFLRQSLCTYPAVNDFLIKCLTLANQTQNEFDT